MYDVTLVDVVKRRDELSDEGPGDRVGEATVLLALDVGEQLAALGVLGHQAIQRRRLSITQTARMKYAIFFTTIYTIIVKKLNSLKHLVRTTVAELHN